MLSIQEKLKLSARSNDLLKQSQNRDVSITERLKITSERNGIIKQLGVKVPTEKPAPAPEPAQGQLTPTEFGQLSDKDKRSQIGDYLFKSNWHEYEMKLFPSYKLVDKTDKYVVYDDNGILQFGYRGHIARGYSYWKNDAGSASKQGGFGSWSRADRTKAMKTIDKIQAAQQEKLDNESDLIKRFRAFEFSRIPANDFVDVVRDVYTEGLDLDAIKAGMINWLEVNGRAA